MCPSFSLLPQRSWRVEEKQFGPVVVEGSRWVVLVNPGFGVEYQVGLSRIGCAPGPLSTPLSLVQRELDRQSRVSWAQLIAAAENDFEAPVFAAHAKLREIKRSLQAQGAEIALLSGSGATVFGVFVDEATARARPRLSFASETFDEGLCRSHLFRPARLAVRTATISRALG